MTLRISKDLSLPIDAVTQAIGFLGRRGSGKTFAATKLAELMLEAGAQVIAIDPVGVWFGLRMGNGFNIPVLGGLHGDIPLESTAGALVADMIVDRSISAVLDISQMIKSEQTRFATDFATRFFERKKASPSAVHLFLEECQELVPQNCQRGEERMLHAFERLVKLGRNFGIGVSLISQRPQEVNKKALNQTELLFVFQMTGPQERKAIEGWVADKGIDEDLGSLLPKLEVGTPRAWSPQWLKISKTIKIAPKRSLDTSSTPKVGARAEAAKALTPIDLQDLRKAMAATIDRAKAEDPRTLRARVAELEKQLSSKMPTKVERVEVPVLTPAAIDSLTKAVDKIEQSAKALLASVTQMREMVRGTTAVPAVKPRETREGIRTWASGDAEAASDKSITGGLRRMMTALAQRPDGLTHQQLGVRAAMSSKSGTFSTYLSRARSNGWIDGDRGPLRITRAGLDALGAWSPLPTGRGLLEHWINDLGNAGSSRMLRALAEAYPRSMSHEELGAASGMAPGSGTFSTYLSKLRSLELVEGRAELKMSEELA